MTQNNPHNEMPYDHIARAGDRLLVHNGKVIPQPHNEMPKDTVEERGTEFHMQGLSRAENAKDIGDCTVVRLGFVTSLMHDAYDKGVAVGRETERAEILKNGYVNYEIT